MHQIHSTKLKKQCADPARMRQQVRFGLMISAPNALAQQVTMFFFYNIGTTRRRPMA
jgi:hypothetical protein